MKEDRDCECSTSYSATVQLNLVERVQLCLWICTDSLSSGIIDLIRSREQNQKWQHWLVTWTSNECTGSGKFLIRTFRDGKAIPLGPSGNWRTFLTNADGVCRSRTMDSSSVLNRLGADSPTTLVDSNAVPSLSINATDSSIIIGFFKMITIRRQ